MSRTMTPQDGKVDFIVGGQWGSEGKGAAAAWLAAIHGRQNIGYDVITTNAGAQAGHTSLHNGKKRVVYHLPTYPLIWEGEAVIKDTSIVYLNAGSIIDPEGLERELNENSINDFRIHPMAAVITDDCREFELRPESSHTKIAGTRKGVGQALSRKVARSGTIARDHPFLKQFVHKIDLNDRLANGSSILVEVPQGVSLSVNHSRFYPYVTSRDCTPMFAMSDAGIHPSFYGKTMVVLRTFPIRVGNIIENGRLLGTSGGCYTDQKELTWEDIGVEAEITTVTKRVRRVFTFSVDQIIDTFGLCRPDFVYLTFCDYLKSRGDVIKLIDHIHEAARLSSIDAPRIIYQIGPSTEDVRYGYNDLNLPRMGEELPDPGSLERIPSVGTGG